MKRILLVAVILLAGCKPKDGAVGPTGPTGAPGDAIPSYQVVFKQGEYPISTFSGFTFNNIDQANISTAYTNDGTILLSQSGQNQARRIILRCAISNWIPQNATVTSAVLKLSSTVATVITGASVTLGVFDLSIPAMVDTGSCIWTTVATWQRHDGTWTWDTCGGTTTGGVMVRGQQFAQNPMDTVVIPTTANTQNLMWAWNLTPSVVQKWLNEPTKNNGIVLTSIIEGNETASGMIIIGNPGSSSQVKPELVVNYYIP